ncbi:flagellar basal body L-ring protein FlgH [Rhodoferax sp.]|uniref:flagellar basal body L-ring protein FlgH n=1 Tax=Rhodoferax sp. TaxID=50421 RepID=UPI002757056D|nr:flagellar basal body L-ring protein FlgH [Rhodoferax sp.]
MFSQNRSDTRTTGWVNRAALGAARMAMTAGVVLLMAACSVLPQKISVDFAETKSVAPMAQATGSSARSRATSGSLFNASTYRPSFEDYRARAVGDTVTINIVENVAATQTSKSIANRSTAMDASVSAFPLLPAAEAAKLKIGTKSANDFSGKGETESKNDFTGTITTTVIEVLSNGHLVVAGDKQIGVNQNVDVLRFSGTVDPRVVQPGSIVNSTQVANARIESRGRGASNEAQTVGWLSRFFFSLLPF